ncbi:hypothetical protein [Ruminococcus flavefaciens]|nr:hypothetical protein [Ruminococcus flavefaciens]
MREYIAPEIEVIIFDTPDVITTSGGGGFSGVETSEDVIIDQ